MIEEGIGHCDYANSCRIGTIGRSRALDKTLQSPDCDGAIFHFVANKRALPVANAERQVWE